ncbi:MAG: hypothetical protein COB02_02405 [Candidatus Cloacimonadota bacterium]|nr:MAG: hypothetical protein COB02_02405 [Candidatus Cloacimonadota bacterium]
MTFKKIILILLFCSLSFGANDKKVVTKALYSFFNQKSGELILKGNAEIVREDIKLYADEIFYNEKKKEAFAVGKVKLDSNDFVLESGQVRIYLPGNANYSWLSSDEMVIIAQKHPKLTQKVGKSKTYTQITAVEIKFFKESEKIEAFENVRMVQLKVDGLKVQEDVVITGKYLEYLSKQKKALVKGDVNLETQDMGAVGQRLIFYQEQKKFYVIDKAKVFQYDKDGNVENEIRGNKILHLIKEDRTILMGNVEGSLDY